MAQDDIGEALIRDALERLLAWPELARSAQLARFLDYIVSKALAGEVEAIKAYSIAVDVFGRPQDFDPQADPIVRVQARRLRSLLQQYYESDGASEPVRIELPTGRYVPEFVRQQAFGASAVEIEDVPAAVAAAEPAAGGRLPSTWFMLAAMAIAGGSLALSYSNSQLPPSASAPPPGLVHPPVLAVTEFQSLTGDRADSSIVAGLAVELVTDLEQFETVAVTYGGSTADAGLDEGTDFTLSGIVRREVGGLQYGAILTEESTGDVVWNLAVGVENEELDSADLLDYVSGRLSSVLGSPRGPLHRAARALIDGPAPLVGGENIYLCRMMFEVYRERGTLESGERAVQCLMGLGPADREAGPMMAAEASLIVDNVPGSAPAEISRPERMAMADGLLDRALRAAPVSAFVWEQRARDFELSGQHEAAEGAYSSALQLNPANTDIMAERALHLMFMGARADAVAMAQRALEDGPDEPPPWYYGVPAIEAIRTGNYARAAEEAQVYARADRELGPILAVIAGQGLGDMAIVNSYLPRVLEVAEFRAAGIITRLRMRIVDQGLLSEIANALLAAGVPQASLYRTF